MTTKAFITVLFTGCAATQGMSTLPQADHPSGVSVSFDTARATSDEAQRWFPEQQGEAALPSAQHIRRELLTTADHFAIGVRVCVTPDGGVSRVDLAASSGVAELDAAALHDIRAWRYEQFAGPSRLQTCKPMTLSYTP